jgi:tetratricopeptide (TPR) repeat protein
MTSPLRRPLALMFVPALVLAVSACGATPTGPQARSPDVTQRGLGGVAGPSSPPLPALPAAMGSPGPAAPSPRPSPPPLAVPVPGAATRAEVDRLATIAAAEPDDPDAQRELGQALLQLIRETLDPSLYAAAGHALTESDRLRPDDARTLAALGALQLGKHQFATALATGRRAVELSPTMAAAHGVVVDALVELGRYDEAEAAAGRMLAVGDDLGTLARISYQRELHGDLRAARNLMAQAAERPGIAPENQAFALAILGNLDRWTGHSDAAKDDWERALVLVPDHPPSLAGLARLALGRGDLEGAERLFSRASGIVPLPEYVIALGEVQARRGEADAARISFGTAATEIGLFKSAGVVVDVDLALFEADHGDPAAALDLARAGWHATPTTRAADAMAWTLHRLGRDAEAGRWSRRALALGSRDPLLRYHAGAIEAAIGNVAAARRDLRAALATDPGFSAAGAADARRLIAELDN